MKKLIYIFGFFLLLFSCKKDKLGPQCVSCIATNIDTSNSNVVVINEGNFGFGNASIFNYDEQSNLVSQNLFQQKNNLPLGDVAQSMISFNGKGYIVVNNSNKIEVVNLTDFSSIATITGFNSPRYFLPINNSKAYVTDLYSNSIQIVDLTSNTITGNIAVNGWTEQLLAFKDTAYVCDMTNDNLLLFNTLNNTFIDSIKVGKSPNSLIKDKNNNIWILCDGGINQNTPELIKFNPNTRNIEKTYLFSSISESPSRLKTNGTKDKLYFINQNIYEMNINDSILPSAPLIYSNGNLFYGLGINPISNQIYVSDAIDYVQNGIVFRYDSIGVLIYQFQSGIIPSDFLFLK